MLNMTINKFCELVLKFTFIFFLTTLIIEDVAYSQPPSPNCVAGQECCGCFYPSGLTCTAPSGMGPGGQCPSVTFCHDDNTLITSTNAILGMNGHFATCTWTDAGFPTSDTSRCEITVTNRTTTAHIDDSLGACTPPPECEFNSDCSDGLTCTDDICSNGVCSNPIVTDTSLVCRESAGECDVAETCNGVSELCPADMFAQAGTMCTDTVFDEAPQDNMIDCTTAVCDDLGMCDQTIPTNPLPMECLPVSGDECTVETEDEDCNDGLSCTRDFCVVGDTNVCDHEIISSEENFVCREASGECDAAEVCDGFNDTCPADTFEEVGTLCTDTIFDGPGPNDCTTAACDDMGMCLQDTATQPLPFECLPPTNGDEPIPTLSEWGLIFLMAFLFMVAVWRMKHHQTS